MIRFFTAPSQLDIVYGKFPYDVKPSSPGPVPHPCLVLDVLVDEATNEPWVLVAFGTSKKVAELRPGQFAVLPRDGRAFEVSGLKLPTKFSLERDKLARLPYNDEWFSTPPERRARQTHPKIGVLDRQHYARALQAAGLAVDVVKTLAELESIAVGALPPATNVALRDARP